jgi:hypothetical protein
MLPAFLLNTLNTDLYALSQIEYLFLKAYCSIGSRIETYKYIGHVTTFIYIGTYQISLLYHNILEIMLSTGNVTHTILRV